MMPQAIVVGAGLGGLATAARLARAGYRVTVFEKDKVPGGRCGRLEADGYRFDTGATLYLMPYVFEELFSYLGTAVSEHLQLHRVQPTYRIHFQDQSHLDLTPDLVALRDQLEAFEPGAFASALQFLATGARYHAVALQRFVGRNFRRWYEFFNPVNLPLLFRAGATRSHLRLVSRHFRDPRLRAAFSFQSMYLGLSPLEAMATYALLQYSELCEGVWFPRGGIYEVILAISSIAQSLGVRIEFETPVTAIAVADGRADGCVLADGRTVRADVVVANADLPYVYGRLLPDDGEAARLARKRYTSSALVFCWGLRGKPSAALLHHNVFVADQEYRASFDRIFRDHTLPDRPSFYVCAPSRTDPGMAPDDGDALMVLVPVGCLNEAAGQDWPALHNRARCAVLEKLYALGLDVASALDFEASWGPREYQSDLNLTRGSAFGLSHNLRQVGYLRPHNRHRRYRNLYFVGASTHPGTGLPLVLLSARLVCERILTEQGNGR
ncbi:MAG: phytoene desaturase [Armatimonadetes bacterium]|nr:phytoene desaturase [Armatimonadota bacterium]